MQHQEPELFKLLHKGIVRKSPFPPVHGKRELFQGFAALFIAYIGIVVAGNIHKGEGTFQQWHEILQGPFKFPLLTAAGGIPRKQDKIRFLRKDILDCRGDPSCIIFSPDDGTVQDPQQPLVKKGTWCLRGCPFMGIGKMKDFYTHRIREMLL